MVSISAVVVHAVLDSTVLFLFLILLTIAVYFIGRSLASPAHRHSSFLLIVIVGVVTSILCFYKYALVQTTSLEVLEVIGVQLASLAGTRRHIFFVGISYFSFKFIHYLVDCHGKKITEPGLLTFVNYILFFPSFFSGPINRFEGFAANIRESDKSVDWEDTVEGIKRIINGLFKKTVLAANLFPHSLAAIDFDSATLTTFQSVLSIYAYMFYIYFDFSGYSDMAIGAGRLVGIRLPENFNYPFLKRNLQQFWANWHMSLTTWLTDYIYWPLVRRLRHFQKMKKMPVTLSNVCIVTTFLVCGLWHGDGLNFILWGLYHGVGLAILNVYTALEKKYFSMKLRKLINTSKMGYAVSTFITFQYVAFGFMLFGLDFEKQRALLGFLAG
jgi:alginate O-acetyltransferase complex protein AlgI